MRKMIKAPIINFPKFEATEPCGKMCKTCAYRKKPTKDEEDYERDMFVERGFRPHLCHSDHQYICKGSWSFTKKLGLH